MTQPHLVLSQSVFPQHRLLTKLGTFFVLDQAVGLVQSRRGRAERIRVRIFACMMCLSGLPFVRSFRFSASASLILSERLFSVDLAGLTIGPSLRGTYAMSDIQVGAAGRALLAVCCFAPVHQAL